MINGMGSSREVVRWVFNAEPGDVTETPFQVEDKVVVPVLTRVYEKGLMPVEKARPLVESILRNEEKAKQITAKIGNAATLDAAAKATSQQVTKADSIMFSSSFIPNVGQEPKVIGASFNKAFQAKVSPAISGNGGVFVVKVDNVSAVATGAGDVQQQQQQMVQAGQRAYSNPQFISEVLKKTVTIKDYRHKFF